MIIFLYGPDSYRRLQKLAGIQKAYREKRGNLSEEKFDFSEEECFENFKSFIANRSLFDKTKLAIVENLFGHDREKEIKKLLVSEIETKDFAIVIVENKKPPAAFSFLIKEGVQFQEFPELESAKLTFFINKEAENRKFKLSAKTAEAIANSFGSDTWAIITELEKMALMADAVLESKSKPEYFACINILKNSKSFKQKISVLETLLSDRGDDPARVFNSLSYKLTNVEEARALAGYDLTVKSGKLDYEEVLVDLALS
ncbi:MAG: hypothetical protein HYR95_00270 [Candidatus Colwellbacteria bacterium]|nr:hypothetical protein [Candidatus Colwellbacteria bacterium]